MPVALGRALARCGLEVSKPTQGGLPRGLVGGRVVGGGRREESGAAEMAKKGGHTEVEVTLDGEYVQ